eukprot:CAMPEP_0171135294 /NCGR_PEP_ID=MMETSP0766_2-20121228/129573_1 /TAXON_ID=439317 /ORGANISM="Gambierdiscus australes, Strain CAWD 149" /LENGTH=93 /DNA_ID=CAMNT_0011598785 /DNA_START=333 /DNA_END=614 /DNA_ORIENTATION=+
MKIVQQSVAGSETCPGMQYGGTKPVALASVDGHHAPPAQSPQSAMLSTISCGFATSSHEPPSKGSTASSQRSQPAGSGFSQWRSAGSSASGMW